jgi:phosphoglycerate dehydrogenase-like enzyme
MEKIIKVTSSSFSKNKFLVEELKKYFPKSTINSENRKFSEDELKDFLKDSNGAIIGLESINKNILPYCPSLEIISKYGVGIDNIDQQSCENNKIAVRCSPGINKTSVAEQTLCFMLGLSRNIFQCSYKLKENNWNKSGGYELSGKTLGIIGVGNIGKEVIRLLQPFNCEILANDIVNQDSYYKKNNLQESTKEEIYEKANIISIHTPLTDLTENMISKDSLSLMNKSTYLINTARGKIINQKDLKEALKSKKIAGAALDVFEEEPLIDQEFISLENLIVTPHIGGNSEEAVRNMGLSSIKHLREFFGK